MTNITVDAAKSPVKYGFTLTDEEVTNNTQNTLQGDNESVFAASSNTTRVQEHSGFHLFDKLEWDPEIGDAMPCKGALSKAGDAICGVFQGIGNFFSDIFSSIGNFFTGLFGENKETEKTDKNTKEDNVEENNTESSEWAYCEGGNLPDKSTLDFDVPDDIKQELIDKFNLDFYMDHDCVEIFYDTDGELILLMPTGINEKAENYRQYGEIRYQSYSLKTCSDMVGIAVNVEADWSTSEENLKTRDGEIGDTKQGQKGDCWLLSGVNALSYTEEGRKMIKDALEYHDSYTTVHLKGAKDYDITDEEVEKARVEKYSTGDDDMLILELAIQKAFEDVDTKDVILSSGYISKNVSNNNGDIEGSNSINLIYLITGKEGKVKSINSMYPDGVTYEDMLLEELDNFEANNAKDFSMVLSAHNEKTAEDTQGNEVAIYGPHAYAVKEVGEDTVTFTNPHNSGVEITFSKDEVLKIFDGFSNCDLSDENPVKPAELPAKTYEDGSKAYIEDLSYFNFMDATYYSKDGEKTGSFSVSSTSNTIKRYNAKGEKKEEYEIPGVDLDNASTKELLESIVERNLFNYKDLSLDKIVELAGLNESEWQKARKNLS